MTFIHRKSGVRVLLPSVVGLLALAGGVANAQTSAGPVLYSGNNAGVTVSSIGSGTAEASKPTYGTGAASLKIVTHGLYQGVSLALTKPIDLGSYLSNPNAYLQLAISLPTAGGSGAPEGAMFGGPGGKMGGAGGKMSGFGGPGMGNIPSQYQQFARSGGRGPGAAGGGSTGVPSQYAGFASGGSGGGGRTSYATPRVVNAAPLANLRVTLITSDGNAFESLLPLDQATTDGSWKLLNIPVAQFGGLKAQDAQIKEVRVYGDSTGTMYLGKIGVVIDATPLTIEPIADQAALPANERFRFTSRATGGATPLKITWDWDAGDGVQEEAVGRTASHAYRVPGDYVVTVTASDLYGLKAPAKTTFKVHISL